VTIGKRPRRTPRKRKLPAQPVLFYDQDCRFCRASVKAIEAIDRRGRFAMLPFSDPLSGRLLASVPDESRFQSMHLAQPDGNIVSAGDALIELCRSLPGGDWLADSARGNSTARRIFRGGYDFVAQRRDALSRVVPDYAPAVRTPELK